MFMILISLRTKGKQAIRFIEINSLINKINPLYFNFNHVLLLYVIGDPNVHSSPTDLCQVSIII